VTRLLWVWGGVATLVATLLFAVLALAVFSLGDLGEPPMLLNPSESLVDEGVAMVMVCGEQPTRETVNMTAAAVVRDRWTGERWTYRHREGGCVVYYHHPRSAAYGD
jgi:hypothetical protein